MNCNYRRLSLSDNHHNAIPSRRHNFYLKLSPSHIPSSLVTNKLRKLSISASSQTTSPLKREIDPKKQVVIIGVGLVSIFGKDVDAFYDRLLAGECDAGEIYQFYASKFRTPFAGRIRGFSFKGFFDKSVLGDGDTEKDVKVVNCVGIYRHIQEKMADTKLAAAVANKTSTVAKSVICYAPNMITTNGVWFGDRPLDFSLPLFILQLILVVGTTRLLVIILKPLRQPRVVAEILGGIILGPTVLGKNKKVANVIFPLRSVVVLETMANVGLLYFLFLVGVEMDLAVIRRIGKKALAIAFAGMILPFLLGCAISLMFHDRYNIANQVTFILFLGVALSVTAFPVLARLLTELKLLNTEMGRIAMSSALLNDMLAWVLLALAISLSETHASTPLISLWICGSTVVFILICIVIVRPIFFWMMRRTPDGEAFSDVYLCMVLTGVMISGFITDAIGMHSVFGAFVFGLVLPNGQLGLVLIDKLEDFVSGVLLPLFFAISGLKTDLGAINGVLTWVGLLVTCALACVGKVVGTVFVTLMYKMPFRDGVTLGLLMNTKGLVELVVLNVGKDQHVLDDQAFAIMVVTALVMTAVIMPIVSVIYRPIKRFTGYKLRTIQRSRLDAELRVLVCIHTPRNVPTIIGLLDASHPSKKSPICVYVLHLVELTGRASAMLTVHNSRKSGRAINRTQAQSDHIINAFENYQQHSGFISVQPLTAISPYSSMHDDVCSLAEDKRVAMIILPFHKQQKVDGGMETTNPSHQTLNQNVLAHAPCSIGILVDRGLNGSQRLSSKQVTHHIVVLFFGGPDDREALSYAWRMSQHPSMIIHVMRFISGGETDKLASAAVASAPLPINSEALTVITDSEREVQIDTAYMKEFRTKTAYNDSIVYIEKRVNNAEETVAAIRSMENIHDLFIVGRGHGIISPLTAGLTDWSECPELGAIGDLLASSDFAATVSVLVVQQYVSPAGSHADGGGGGICCTPESFGNAHEQLHTTTFHQTNRRSPKFRGQAVFSP